MRILWQSKNGAVADSFKEGSLSAFINGGNAYDVQSALALSEKYNVSVDEFTIRRNESVLKYWLRMTKYKADAELLIMEPFPIVYGKRIHGQKSIAMIHHIDPNIMKSGLYHRWYFNRLLKRASLCDMIVTVSEYWKNYFVQLGAKRVEVIYNSFDTTIYNAPVDEKAFRSKFKIPEGKKIIYIGNAFREKGVYEVYDALKNTDYHLVMTGATNRAADLDVQYMNLSRPEYLTLLRISSVVVANSLMIEGWNRIAHEALLSGTPVIGSGTGGMLELLTKAGQPIISTKEDILLEIENVLRARSSFAEAGLKYVRQFDQKYLKNRWEEIVENVMKG